MFFIRNIQIKTKVQLFCIGFCSFVTKFYFGLNFTRKIEEIEKNFTHFDKAKYAISNTKITKFTNFVIFVFEIAYFALSKCVKVCMQGQIKENGKFITHPSLYFESITFLHCGKHS